MAVRLTEQYAVVGVVDPQLANNTTKSTGWIDTAQRGEIDFFLNLGATDTTVDAKIQEASDSNGTGVTDVTGKAITQFSATDDNKQAIIRVKANELDSGKRFCRLLITIGNGSLGANVSVVALGGNPSRYVPVTHATTVAQTI